MGRVGTGGSVGTVGGVGTGGSVGTVVGGAGVVGVGVVGAGVVGGTGVVGAGVVGGAGVVTALQHSTMYRSLTRSLALVSSPLIAMATFLTAIFDVNPGTLYLYVLNLAGSSGSCYKRKTTCTDF